MGGEDDRLAATSRPGFHGQPGWQSAAHEGQFLPQRGHEDKCGMSLSGGCNAS